MKYNKIEYSKIYDYNRNVQYLLDIQIQWHNTITTRREGRGRRMGGTMERTVLT